MFNFKDPHWRKRFIVMVVGIFFMGMGVELFRLSLTGNDPSTALALAIAGLVGLPLSAMLSIWNTVYFVLEILIGRKYIGPGTFVNWFCVGISADFWDSVIKSIFTIPDTFAVHLIILIIGLLVLSWACALYQEANMGIAPYDSVSLIMTERLPLPYFWNRIITDAACSLIAFLLGGVIGLGTLLCALGMGPFVSFFTKYSAKPLLRESSS